MRVGHSVATFTPWIWLALCVMLIGLPGVVFGQVAPTTPMPPSPASTPVPPTPIPTTPIPPTPIPPTPIPPTPIPPTPIPPTPVSPTPIPPTTPLPPTTPIPPTPIPPRPHPEENVKFYCLEIHIPTTSGARSLGANCLRNKVKDVAELFIKLSHFSELDVIQLYKVVGESTVKAVVQAGLNNGVQGLPLIDKLEDQLCNLGITLKTTPLSSFEAFARAIGIDSTLTQPPVSRVLDGRATIHCYTLEFRPRSTDDQPQALLELTQVITSILQRRQQGQRIDAYKVLATDPPKFFICANTVLKDFDRMFLQYWTLTNKPDTTSVHSVFEAQLMDKYLNYIGDSNCGGFWCSLW